MAASTEEYGPARKSKRPVTIRDKPIRHTHPASLGLEYRRNANLDDDRGTTTPMLIADEHGTHYCYG